MQTTANQQNVRPLREPLDVALLREDFPILKQTVHGKPLVYLDNAATAQKPLAVVDAICDFYLRDNANVHRGVHLLSQRATDLFEATRRKAQAFLNAAFEQEIIYVRGATEGINLVMRSYGASMVGAGDEIIISAMEHHSNIVPWQMLCEEKGAVLKVIPMNDAGELLMDEYERLLTDRTRLVAIVHVSNALGTINPVSEIIELAHDRGIPVLVDGAQSAPHMPIDVQAMDCDFFVCSGHKIFGPTGIGLLYGKRELLEKMPPFHGGGDMISSVTFEKTTYNELPYKFEAGTPSIADVVGLGAALDYLGAVGMDRIHAWETELLDYATAAVTAIPGVRLIGTAAQKAGVLSFVLDGVHPHDIGTFMDHDGIAIRAGHHCAQPVMDRFGVPATARASFAFYNTRDEIDRMVAVIPKIVELFG